MHKEPYKPEVPEFNSSRSRATGPVPPSDLPTSTPVRDGKDICPEAGDLSELGKTLQEMGTAPSGAMRECIGTKIDTSLVPQELVVMAAIGLNYGAGKYAPRNFEKGFRLSDLTNSIDRHNRALMAGERIDNDSGLPHEVLLASSVAMLSFCSMQGRLDYDVPPRDDSVLTLEAVSKAAQNIQNEGQKRREANVHAKP